MQFYSKLLQTEGAPQDHFAIETFRERGTTLFSGGSAHEIEIQSESIQTMCSFAYENESGIIKYGLSWT